MRGKGQASAYTKNASIIYSSHHLTACTKTTNLGIISLFISMVYTLETPFKFGFAVTTVYKGQDQFSFKKDPNETRDYE